MIPKKQWLAKEAMIKSEVIIDERNNPTTYPVTNSVSEAQ